MYETYVLENIQGKHYIGSTQSFDERLLMHNNTSPEKAKFHRTTYRDWLERARRGG
jgi:predicted GIY-YIG superfamily endonuclease